MNIRPEYLAEIKKLGYTETEAAFLYLVATHSGYFTRQQFLVFSAKAKGWCVHRLTSKTLERRHARATEYGRQTYVFNLYTRRIYGPIGKDNLRNRKRQSQELIHVRLLILDFVLSNPDFRYLETEADKLAYFHDTLGLPLPVLPGRIYKGTHSNDHTKRYFIDRFPIFFPQPGNSFALPPLVTFAYCDTADRSLAQFTTHLRNYANFLRRLPAFNFVYAAPDRAKFSRASAFFARLFEGSDRLSAKQLARYFEVRRLWDAGKFNSLTRADRDILRDGDQRYADEGFQSAYQKWLSGSLRPVDLDAILDPPEPRQERNFRTYELPEPYSIFYADAAKDYRPAAWDRWSGSRSASRSVPCDD
jgi:hypothetical protein